MKFKACLNILRTAGSHSPPRPPSPQDEGQIIFDVDMRRDSQVLPLENIVDHLMERSLAYLHYLSVFVCVCVCPSGFRHGEDQR